MRGNRFFYIVVFVTALVLAVSLYFSITELRKNTEKIIYQDTLTIADVIELSSSRILEAQREIEKFYADRLIQAEELIKKTGAKDSTTIYWIQDFSGISRIVVFDEKGEVILNTSEKSPEDELLEKVKSYIEERVEGALPVETGVYYNLVFGSGKRIYAVSVSKSEIREKRIRTGIGSLLSEIGIQGRIVYLALQDENGIIFATRNIRELEKLESDTFLLNAYTKEEIKSRIHTVSGIEVYEVVRPFYQEGELIGLLRVGIDRGFYLSLLQVTERNIILLHALLFVLILVSLSFVMRVKKLREMMVSFDAMVQNLPIGVIRFDSSGKFLSANANAVKLLGIPWEALKKITPEELGFSNVIMRVVNKLRDRKRHISLTLVPVFETKGRRVGSICFIESTELEERVERARELEMIGEIAAQVAHEIKNPLNAISMIIQRIRSEFLVAPTREAENLLRIVEEEVKRIEGSVNRFIGIAAPMRLKRECVNVEELVQEVLELFSEEIRARNIKIEENFRVRLAVRIDRNKMREVFINILKNAIEAMPDGGNIRISLFEKNNTLHICFRDYGMGMDEETFEKAGQPFFTTKAKGSGLGLVFVRRTVEAHGGEIVIKSKKDVGTLVEVILPYDGNSPC